MQRHRTHKWHNKVFFPHNIHQVKTNKNEINQRYMVSETAFYKESQKLLQNLQFKLICTVDLFITKHIITFTL